MKKENKAKKTQDEETRTEEQSEEMQILKNELENMENSWKRALADYKNLQKRSEEEKDSIIRYANQVLIAKLLFILDSLEMLQKHINDQGLSLIVKEFKIIMEEEGLEEINAHGQDFDANCMDALELISGEENKVMEVVQKGYKVKGRVLRPAQVKVGKNN